MIPRRIILHHTAGGTLKGAEDTLRKRGLAYHYMIDKDGSIHRYHSPTDYAAHAAGHNQGSIGIAFVGGGTFGPVNSNQYDALIGLITVLMEKHPTIATITGHKHVSTSGKIDPRWPGEPADGVNLDVDRQWMTKIQSETGLTLILKI